MTWTFLAGSLLAFGLTAYGLFYDHNFFTLAGGALSGALVAFCMIEYDSIIGSRRLEG